MINMTSGYLLSKNSYNPSFYISIKNLISDLKNKIQSLLHKLSKKMSVYLIDNLKYNLELFENILFELTYLSRELFDFMSIKHMYLYVIENQRYDFINKLNSLFEIYYCVVCGKLKNDDEEYPDNYENFTANLIETEKNFYLNIYKKSDDFDESSYSQITNNLLKKMRLS